MSWHSFGIEGITDEDRAYGGSRFSDLREANNAYARHAALGVPKLRRHLARSF